MWSDLPFDLLAYLFSSFLSLDSLACAGSTCRQWHTCFKACILSSTLLSPHQPAWFIALPARNHSLCCYLHNPIRNHWHSLSLDFLPCPVRLVASIGSHLLFKATNPKNLQLLICNPFTRQYKQLPTLHKSRSNPAVAVVTQDSTRNDSSPCFNIYVAGGTSEAMRGYISNYNHNLEVYDSKLDAWRFIGPVPMEFTVRLTVWTPTDSAFSNGVIYWITSARAYSLMGYDISSNTWRELKVPVPNKLEFAATVLRHGKLSLVGGMCGGRGEASIWELREGDTWELIEKVPEQLGLKFVGENESWVGAKCVCNDGAYYLYKDLESGMIVWKEVGDKGKWEWFWVDGCASIGENQVPDLLIKGVLATPNLAPSSSLF